MKTQVEKFAELVTTKASGNQVVKNNYSRFINEIKNGNKYHWFFWYNKGKSHKDYYNYYVQILDSLGIEYCFGNDAKRGGQEGKYIELTKKGKAKRNRLAKQGVFELIDKGVRNYELAIAKK